MRTDEPPYRREPDCTTSPAPAVVDALLGGIAILTAISLYDASSAKEPERATILGSVGAAYAASAVVGFRRIARCRDAKNAWALTR
ncbi:MAG TPA: hypothetical protein VIU61_29815 [Kofleriaceae bacterium]